tara:strand:- start:4274 stop:6019 length:1746 start_codon:yes stop_codon:yes gene_type:complete
MGGGLATLNPIIIDQYQEPVIKRAEGGSSIGTGQIEKGVLGDPPDPDALLVYDDLKKDGIRSVLRPSVFDDETRREKEYLMIDAPPKDLRTYPPLKGMTFQEKGRLLKELNKPQTELEKAEEALAKDPKSNVVSLGQIIPESKIFDEELGRVVTEPSKINITDLLKSLSYDPKKDKKIEGKTKRIQAKNKAEALLKEAKEKLPKGTTILGLPVTEKDKIKKLQNMLVTNKRSAKPAQEKVFTKSVKSLNEDQSNKFKAEFTKLINVNPDAAFGDGANTYSKEAQEIRKEIKNNPKKLEDTLEKYMKDLTPEKIKEPYKDIIKNAQQIRTEYIDGSNKSLEEFKKTVAPYLTKTQLPNLLVYIGAAGAGDPDGFFAGGAKGIGKWAKDNFENDKEYKNFMFAYSKFEKQQADAIRKDIKDLKFGELEIDKKLADKIANLPKEKLAAIKIFTDSKATATSKKIELLKALATMGKRGQYAEGYKDKALKDKLTERSAFRAALGVQTGETVKLNPESEGVLDSLTSYVRNAARVLMKEDQLTKSYTGDTKSYENKVIEMLEKNPKGFERLIRNAIANSKRTTEGN